MSKRYRLALKAMDRLNALNEKYHISCFELEDSDVCNFINKICELDIEKEEREWLYDISDLINKYNIIS